MTMAKTKVKKLQIVQKPQKPETIVVRRGSNLRRRRKKQQLQKNHRCTIQGCTKQYGQQSSLRTHIRNKHPTHIVNFPKKKSAPKSGRPPAINKPLPLNPNNLWDDYKFIEFLEAVMTIEPCDWVREDQDPIAVYDVKGMVYGILEVHKNWDVPYRLLKYLEGGKLVFLQEKIEMLYVMIIEEINKENRCKWGKKIRKILDQENKVMVL